MAKSSKFCFPNAPTHLPPLLYFRPSLLPAWITAWTTNDYYLGPTLAPFQCLPIQPSIYTILVIIHHYLECPVAVCWLWSKAQTSKEEFKTFFKWYNQPSQPYLPRQDYFLYLNYFLPFPAYCLPSPAHHSFLHVEILPSFYALYKWHLALCFSQDSIMLCHLNK